MDHADKNWLKAETYGNARPPGKNPRAQLAPIADQKCLPTGHIFALGCRSRLAEMSRKAAKYRINSVACRYL